MIIKIYCRRCGTMIRIGSEEEDLTKHVYCLSCRRVLNQKAQRSRLMADNLKPQS
ncbi:MAG: hypothetical protein ACE5GD_06395 [Candidatus Geothermarchaeales archaeon]